MEIGDSSVIQRRAGLLEADIGGEVVLMSIERSKYFGLDEIGSDIWRAIEQPTTVLDLCAQLVRRYDGDPDVIYRDVVALLQRLAEHDLLEPVL